jgi:hypothetical protein
MIAKKSTSVLMEIVYLDPDLADRCSCYKMYRCRGALLTMIQLVANPCALTLAAFVALLVIGLRLPH